MYKFKKGDVVIVDKNTPYINDYLNYFINNDYKVKLEVDELGFLCIPNGHSGIFVYGLLRDLSPYLTLYKKSKSHLPKWW